MTTNLNNEEQQEFLEIFNSCFNIKSSDTFLEKQKFFSDYFFVDESTSYITPYLKRDIIEPKSSDELFMKKYHDKSYWVGLDYPVFIRKDNNRKNVMIIAEDPLRDRNDTYLKPNKEDLLLSTPFATHLKWAREIGLREYWQINNSLLEKGCNVYLTDVYKIWMMKDDLTIKKKEKLPADFVNHLKTCLKKEIEFIKPDAIITYGKRAYDALSSMELDFKGEKISFPHPSRTANGAWKKILSEHYINEVVNCSSDFKCRYVGDKLKSQEWFTK